MSKCRPVYPPERTLFGAVGTAESAIRVTSLCDEPRNLFDYIVGECQQRVGYRETYRFGGLKVDHQFEPT